MISNKILRRAAALALSLSLAAAPVSVSASALGEEIGGSSLRLARGAELQQTLFWNSARADRVSENYVVYDPDDTVEAVVAYGNDIRGAAAFRTVLEQAKEAGQQVLAILNGDIFDTANGVAIGLVVKDGLLRSSEYSQYPSVGFLRDGSVLIGSAGLSIGLRSDNEAFGSFNNVSFNKNLSKNSGLMLYSSDYGESTAASMDSCNVMLSIDRGELRLGSSLECSVLSTAETSGGAILAEDRLMLSIASDTSYVGALSSLRALQPGDTVRVDLFITDPRWAEAAYAIGSYGSLVSGGYTNVKSTDTGLNPRTALGVRSDGNVVLYTVDGRRSGHSIGSSLQDLAYRMLELGCVEAVNLDGGGSTALLALYPGCEAPEEVGLPSEGALRRCANYILLLNRASSTGSAAHLHLYPYSLQLLKGAEVGFEVKATDKGYYACELPARLSYDVTGGIGSVSEEGVFLAGAAGKGQVSVSGGGAEGEAEVLVVDRPDSVVLLRNGSAVSSLNVEQGTEISFSAQSFFRHQILRDAPACYEWSVSGGIGSIDERGVFTASNRGEGSVTVSVGGVSASASVKVSSGNLRFEGFEGSNILFSSTDPERLRTEILRDKSLVRYGEQSMKVDYEISATDEETALLSIGQHLSGKSRCISFWLRGDGGTDRLQLHFKTDAGETLLDAGSLESREWKQVLVALPENASLFRGISVSSEKEEAQGSFCLDQFLLLEDALTDLDPPEIGGGAEAGVFRALISDAGDPNPAGSQIALSFDGAPLAFTLSGGFLTAQLPEADGRSHKISLLASDLSGNLSRFFYEIPGDGEEAPFADMAGHWAERYTTYLRAQGIINGVKKDDGLYYQPDKNMSRSEFAVIMSNWLVEDLSAYSAVELPFADLTEIPAWALSQVKAMYSLGYVTGSLDSASGKLYFKPNSSISRQEAMTILGRSQARGYAETDLAGFPDGGSVAGWAAPYLRSLLSQGVISGSNGKLLPQDPVTRGQMAKMVYCLY